jgi:hypothetical protein
MEHDNKRFRAPKEGMAHNHPNVTGGKLIVMKIRNKRELMY